MLISNEYRELNKQLHAKKPTYGMSGRKHAQRIMKLVEEYKTCNVLDYGCGKGSLNFELPFYIHEYDPAIEGKTDLPDKADIVVCTDVLEHIEPECLDAVMGHIRRLTIRVAYLVIACRPANKTLPDGRNAHLIIENWDWWRARMRGWKLVSVEEKDDEVTVICEPDVEDWT